MRRSADGFSVIELTVALALTLIVAGTVAAIVGPARSVFDSQPEAIDVQQRLRVGVEALTRDLIGAGAGSPLGGRSGPLAEVVPRCCRFAAAPAEAIRPTRFVPTPSRSSASPRRPYRRRWRLISTSARLR